MVYRFVSFPCRAAFAKLISHIPFSPDLISRITCTTDVFKAAPGDDSVKEADTGMPNQLLINEYAPGQGISVST